MLNVLQEYKYYKSYQQLLTQSEQVFDTSFYYWGFVDLAQKAYANHQPLDDLIFALDSIENLKNTSGIQYTNTLDKLKLEPHFDSFMSIITNIHSNIYEDSLVSIEDSSLAEDILEVTHSEPDLALQTSIEQQSFDETLDDLLNSIPKRRYCDNFVHNDEAPVNFVSHDEAPVNFVSHDEFSAVSSLASNQQSQNIVNYFENLYTQSPALDLSFEQ